VSIPGRPDGLVKTELEDVEVFEVIGHYANNKVRSVDLPHGRCMETSREYRQMLKRAVRFIRNMRQATNKLFMNLVGTPSIEL
jgi:hypothetical protein